MVYMLKIFCIDLDQYLYNKDFISKPSVISMVQIFEFFFSDSEEENQNSDTTNSDEDSDGLEIRLDFQPLN